VPYKAVKKRNLSILPIPTRLPRVSDEEIHQEREQRCEEEMQINQTPSETGLAIVLNANSVLASEERKEIKYTKLSR